MSEAHTTVTSATSASTSQKGDPHSMAPQSPYGSCLGAGDGTVGGSASVEQGGREREEKGAALSLFETKMAELVKALGDRGRIGA
jgi:hypothetical protein